MRQGLSVTISIIICITAIMVFGCAPRHLAMETPGRAPVLDLQPDSLGRSLSLSHIVTGTYGEQSRSMRFEIQVEGNSLVVAALSPIGETLFVLEQEGDNVVVQTFADDLSGTLGWILFDIQVAYWPGDRLDLALSGQKMRLEDKPFRGVRHVYGPRGDLLLEVRYLDGFLVPGNIIIEHFDRPYRLRINTPKSERKL